MVLGVEKWCSRKQLSFVPYTLTSKIGVKELLGVILDFRMDVKVLLVDYFSRYLSSVEVLMVWDGRSGSL